MRWIDRLIAEHNPSIEDLHSATSALIFLPDQPMMVGRLLKLVEYRQPD